MLWSLFLFSTLLFLGPLPQQPSATPAPAAATSVPADAARMVNPYKPNAASMARAKKMYGYDCALCHAANGNGKGDAAVDMKLTLKDWTDPAALKDMTDGELFYIIKNGKGQMTGEDGRASTEDLWNMVVMTRAFTKQ